MKRKRNLIWGISAVVIVLLVVFFAKSLFGNSNKETSNKTKTVKVLTYANWNPFEYIKNGKLVGFDIDFIKALSKEENLKIKIKNVSWEGMFTQLQNKKADLGISGITITKDREKTFDFSDPYFVSYQSIVVPKKSSVKKASDLKNLKIAVQTGSTGQNAVQKLFGKNDSNILATQSGVTYQMVVHGQADAAVGDNTNNKKFIENNKNYNLKVVQDRKAFSSEYFGLMFPKNSPYKKKYNQAIKKLMKNGTYEKLYKKWFGVKPNLKDLNNSKQ